MGRRGRNILIGGAGALALIALASPHRRADFELQMHRAGDTAPERVQAVVDLGLVAVSVIVTWSKRLGY